MFKKLILVFAITVGFFCLISHQNKWQTKLVYKIKQQEIPLWMLEQISEDLTPFSSGISTAMLDRLVETSGPDNRYALARFQVKGGRLEVVFAPIVEKARRFRTIKRSLETLCKTVPMPELDFVVTIEDASPIADPPGPLFAFAKNRYREKKVVLIPDDGALRGNSSWLAKVKEGKKRYPWNAKENKLFWRGSTTGGCATLSTFQTLPRAQLVRLSLQFPELVDARFNHLVQMDKETEQKLLELGYKGDTVSVVDHLKYKYQILIDGNTCAYTRAFWQLYSDCAIFKQNSDNIQWFYRALAPGVHYVAIQEDMSDLVEKVQWAQTDDAEVQKIVKNANLFARYNLQIEDMHLYLYLLLCEYAKLIRK